MNLDDFFNELAADNSRNFKIAKLNENANDELLKEVIRLALDTFTQFYIRKIPAYKQIIPNVDIGLEEAINQLGYLSKRVYTGNAGIAHLTHVLQNLPADKARVIERIIGKDLKCGVSVSTVNTVWPNLIHEYPVMLCSKFEKKLVDKITFPAIAQKKEDGMRFNAIVLDGKCEFRSRNGKEIMLLGNLEQEFVEMAAGKNLVFDGELLVANNDGVIQDRQTGNGILNKANKGTITEEQAAKVHAQLWDLIPYEEFVKGKSNDIYVIRWDNLLACPTKSKKIHFVETFFVNSLSAAQEIFEQYLADGFEGIILKDTRGLWEDKRTKQQIKFKGEEECDLKIVGIQPGTGKYTGMLGAILCESADGILKVDVGSGFSDAQRATLKDEIIGKIAAVKYNMRIKNKQGEESLFLPILIEIRDDKTVADSIGDIA
jgi:hypothetical protein